MLEFTQQELDQSTTPATELNVREPDAQTNLFDLSKYKDLEGVDEELNVLMKKVNQLSDLMLTIGTSELVNLLLDVKQTQEVLRNRLWKVVCKLEGNVKTRGYKSGKTFKKQEIDMDI